jgi:hypothetical protein
MNSCSREVWRDKDAQLEKTFHSLAVSKCYASYNKAIFVEEPLR